MRNRFRLESLLRNGLAIVQRLVVDKLVNLPLHFLDSILLLCSSSV